MRDIYYHWRTKFMEACYSRLPMPGLTRPVFILGCGRSGKSTLASLLSHHPDIVYLNEPRHFWTSAFPGSDIWTSKAAARGGRLALGAEDFDSSRGARLSRLYRLRAIRGEGSTVVEELDTNCFRLPLIRRIFPEARFIHIYRNGLEVAEMIHRAVITRGCWFGPNDYKWQQLVAYAARHPETRNLPALCRDDRDKGLLEWRLSTEAVVSFLRELPRETYLEINSSELFKAPENVLARIFRLLDLEDKTMIAQANVGHSLDRNKDPLPEAALELSDKARRLGGPMLLASLQSSGGLVEARSDMESTGPDEEVELKG